MKSNEIIMSVFKRTRKFRPNKKKLYRQNHKMDYMLFGHMKTKTFTEYTKFGRKFIKIKIGKTMSSVVRQRNTIRNVQH